MHPHLHGSYLRDFGLILPRTYIKLLEMPFHWKTNIKETKSLFRGGQRKGKGRPLAWVSALYFA